MEGENEEETLYPIMSCESRHGNQRRAAIKTNEKFGSSARNLISGFKIGGGRKQQCVSHFI